MTVVEQCVQSTEKNILNKCNQSMLPFPPTVEENHVFRIGDEEIKITTAIRADIELLFPTSARAVAKRYDVPVYVISHIWNEYRRRHDLPAVMI